VLLHGFPDFWYTWKAQIPDLSEKFHVVAPDLRGYNKSDKPHGVENYSTQMLVQDITGLIKGFGKNSAIIVGHDWGGSIAWNMAMMNPTIVSKLIILNCPHPIPLLEAFWSMRFQQLQKSWYVFFFQLSKVPEEVLSRNNYETLRRLMRSSLVDRRAITDEDLEKYVEAWSQPGALAAMINYYRANWNIANILSMSDSQKEAIIQRFPKVKCPTLVIWGEKDVALDKSLTYDMEKYIDNELHIKYIQDAGHWVHIEVPKQVNTHIRNFLSSN